MNLVEVCECVGGRYSCFLKRRSCVYFKVFVVHCAVNLAFAFASRILVRIR